MSRRTAHPTPTRPKSSGLMTLQEVLEELKVSRSTFDDWRAKGLAPECIKLPNNQLRIRRSVLDQWLVSIEEACA